MSRTHPHVWTSKVHTYLLESKTTATSEEICRLFGRPSGSISTGMRIANAAQNGWFEVVCREQKPFRYRAVSKDVERQQSRPNWLGAKKPFEEIGRNAQPWPSVWAYASQGASA